MTKKDSKICDNTSVGIIVRKNDKILLIERGTPPAGFAPPAGHVDQHGSYEEAAKAELKEEVNLTATDLKLLHEERKENSCKRKGGDHHYWKIYEAEAEGQVEGDERETKQTGWYTREEIAPLMKRTEEYNNGNIPEDKWTENPGIEPVWYEFFKDLDIV